MSCVGRQGIGRSVVVRRKRSVIVPGRVHRSSMEDGLAKLFHNDGREIGSGACLAGNEMQAKALEAVAVRSGS